MASVEHLIDGAAFRICVTVDYKAKEPVDAFWVCPGCNTATHTSHIDENEAVTIAKRKANLHWPNCPQNPKRPKTDMDKLREELFGQ